VVLAGLASVLLSDVAPAGAPEAITFGVLSYGTAAWEVDVIRRHRLDEQQGFALQAVPLASGEATKVALLANAVDIIVSDLVWATRQRAEGEKLTFLPYSRALGALELPAGSNIGDLSDLTGKRLGVAGGALDKSWLLLRAFAIHKLGKDLAEVVDPVFGAPPLIMQEFDARRLDAALTFWNFAAQMEAHGARPLLTVADMIGGLGVARDIPVLGYVIREEWARRNSDLLDRFTRCTRTAKTILAKSDLEWISLEPLLGTDEPGVRLRLRDAYRAGIPAELSDEKKHDAARLFSILADIGGEQLVGRARSLDPAVFWTSAVL
jgi:NitT/TauT family transport system substrate-binding protein